MSNRKNPDVKKKSSSSGFIDVFEQYSEDYDSWYSRHGEVYESEVWAIKALGLRGLGLDIGVGTGALSYRTGVTVGIDPSLPMLRIAKKRGIQVVRAAGEYLPFRDRFLDYVIMTVTFCFLDNPEDVLKEAWRVLREDGHLGVCIITRDSPWGKLYVRKASMGHRFYRFAKFYTYNELLGILKEHMFETVSVKSTLSYPPEAEHRVEEPTESTVTKGFICVKSKKL
jgi:ubiquinone/menaquinone biosynthesis C-methylase UbiE